MLIETSLAPGREMLRGIARFARAQGRWATFLEPRSLEESVPGWLATWKGDGIIARVQNPQIAAAVLATGIPAVDVLGAVPTAGLPLVHTDDVGIAELAVGHLANQGFERLAFFGIAGERWSQQRRDAVVSLANRAGRSCTVFETPRDAHHTRDWETYADDLATWVGGLPKPVGLILCSDQCGPVVLEACRRAGAAVPDEVAVIGVDNDEPLCEVAYPGLSSVWPDHEGVGHAAAALLDRLMRGEPPPADPTLLAPRGIVTRTSTDALAIADRDVAAAVRVIRERACVGLTADEVSARVGTSRTVLQRRFKAAVGRTLHEEMLRVRLARARDLLAHTDLPIATVAERAGFNHQEYLGVVFRRHVGQTPARFRKAAGRG